MEKKTLIANIYNKQNKINNQMTPIQTVVELLKKLDTQFPQPTKPSDKPTYNEGVAFVIQELLPQIEQLVEAEKELLINSIFWGKTNPSNYNDALEYYQSISK